MHTFPFPGLGGLCLVWLIVPLLCCGPQGKASAPGSLPGDREKAAAGHKVNVELYVMSQCLHGTRFQKTMKEILDEMGDSINFKQYFIVAKNEDGTFTSLSGQDEIRGNIIQLCAARHHGENYLYMDFVACMAGDLNGIPDNWEKCAKKTGMDRDIIKKCAAGGEGKKLLSFSVDHVEKNNIFASPTLLIEGAMFLGAKGKDETRRFICCGFDKTYAPQVCEGMMDTCPGQTTINVTALTDKRCQECDPFVHNALMKFKDLFPKLEFEIIDYSDEKGKTLYEEAGGEYLPLFVFDPAVANEMEFDLLAEWTVPAGDWIVVKAGKIFHPLKEICDNGKDDNGNGKIDCDDEGCAGSLPCREETPAALDLFAMSLCPFGRQAENAMKEVLDYFKKSLKFNLYFIVDFYTAEEFEALPPVYRDGCDKMADGNYYCTLHGYPELVENLVQACARKHYGKNNRYMEFILCRNKNIYDPKWEECAEENKMDVEKIRACAESEEGLSIIGEDALLVEALDVTGSPTFIGNNNRIVKVLDYTAEDIIVEICLINEGLKKCKNRKPKTVSKDQQEKEEPLICGE